MSTDTADQAPEPDLRTHRIQLFSPPSDAPRIRRQTDLIDTLVVEKSPERCSSTGPRN